MSTVRTLRWPAALAALLFTQLGWTQQQPTQPGWPQPMHNNPMLSYAALNQNELRTGNGSSTYRWAAEGWYGGNLNRAWFKTEGNLDADSGRLDDAQLQALYSRAVSRYFDLQAGLRYDFQPAPSRGWAVVGVQGLAPYFFELGAHLFVSNAGNYAARLETSYDLLITQRLILRPQAEINFYAKGDARRGIGAGLSDLDAGLRLRYEWRRKLAPYVGLSYERRYVQSAEFARQDGGTAEDLRAIAGIRLWF